MTIVSTVAACRRSKSAAAIAGPSESALTNISTIYEMSLRNKKLFPKMFQMCRPVSVKLQAKQLQ